jgi:hypothetical protein
LSHLSKKERFIWKQEVYDVTEQWVCSTVFMSPAPIICKTSNLTYFCAMNIKYLIVKPEEIDSEKRKKMFLLMDFHYANTILNDFLRDLNGKTDVIMLFDAKSDELVGFSTQKIFPFRIGEKEILVLYSGDTIIRKEYWGSLHLSIAFGKLMIDTILSNPDKEFYWMLISKGVRTFKFLPAYFIEYYPMYGIETPEPIKRIMDALAFDMYPLQYDPQHGVIRALPQGQYLRETFQQSKLTGNMAINNFFSLNPGYTHGDELVCLTRLSFDNIRPFIKEVLVRAFQMKMN